MRLLKSLASLPYRATLELVWSRITLSKITILYFLFSFLHASLQIILQAEVYSINSQATNLVNAIAEIGNVSTNGFSILQNGDLLWCNDPRRIPGSCSILWSTNGNSTQIANVIEYSSAESENLNPNSDTTASAAPSVSSSFFQATETSKLIGSKTAESPQHTVKVTLTVTVLSTQATESVILSKEEEEIIERAVAQDRQQQYSERSGDLPDLNVAAAQILDDPKCLTALNWPLETLRNTKREDIVFLNFHVWVLGMSIIAILNESLVHMVATLVTHAFLTAWSVFQILNTHTFQNNFNRIVTHGACFGTHLLPNYWRQRTSVEIPAAALNGAALVLSAILTWRLVVTYNWATFKRIGANRKVSKAYKMVLTFSVALQLSLFFIVVSLALWIDQLCNGAIGMFAILMNVYKGVDITILIFLTPWIVIGWRAVRSEHRLLMAGFLAFSLLLIGGWASMFASTTFRLTFMQWRFFAIMSILALLLTLSCLVFGIMCRLNFGVDLKRHLIGQENLPDGFVSAIPSDDRQSVYSYEEKVAFPESTLPSVSHVITDESTSSQNPIQISLNRSSSTSSTTTISSPIMSRFSIDSSDGDTCEIGSNISHQRNGSGKSKGSRRWIIE